MAAWYSFLFFWFFNFYWNQNTLTTNLCSNSFLHNKYTRSHLYTSTFIQLHINTNDKLIFVQSINKAFKMHVKLFKSFGTANCQSYFNLMQTKFSSFEWFLYLKWLGNCDGNSSRGKIFRYFCMKEVHYGLNEPTLLKLWCIEVVFFGKPRQPILTR